jgi:hypothetical protein
LGVDESEVARPARSASIARFGNRTPGTVFVTSQALYYDTFVVKVPMPLEGAFQLLVNGTTEGYLGCRCEDLNGNGVQDESDQFFLCPLLPPGRTTRKRRTDAAGQPPPFRLSSLYGSP